MPGVCLLIRIVAATVPDRIGHANAVDRSPSASCSPGWRCCSCCPWPVGVFASTVIVAIGISFQYPSLMAMVVDTVPERERVRAISTFTMFFEIGTAAVRCVLGTFADLTSKRSAFLGGAVFCAVGLVVLWKVAVPRSRGPRGCLISASAPFADAARMVT